MFKNNRNIIEKYSFGTNPRNITRQFIFWNAIIDKTDEEAEEILERLAPDISNDMTTAIKQIPKTYEKHGIPHGEKIQEEATHLMKTLELQEPGHRSNPETKKASIDNDCTIENLTILLLQHKRRAVTEILTLHLQAHQHIHTTRVDENNEMWIYQNGIYVPQGKTYIKEFCRTMLGHGYTTSLCNEVISKIEAETYIEQDDLFQNTQKEYIAIKNGILNLITKELTEFTPEKKFFNKIPINYMPGIECPIIQQHFTEVLANEADTPIIQELFGYLLWKEYKIEKAFMFCGNGRNGKGKTLELMKLFIGLDNCSNIPLQHFEKDPFSIGELFNKMANLGGDISSTALKETGNFKSLTGRDMISANRKFKTRVNFVNYAKMIFCANELPRTSDKTVAFFNRWILVDFPYTFVSKQEFDSYNDNKLLKIADPDIVAKLTSEVELTGLLNWALEGLDRLFLNNGFSHSKTTENVKEMWLRRSDSFAGFLMDELVEDWDSMISKGELRRAYSLYCRSHKLTGVSDISIKITLSTTWGVIEDRYRGEGSQIPYWKGIKFKSGKDGMDGMGFSTYSKKTEFPIASKSPTEHTTLTESLVNNVDRG